MKRRKFRLCPHCDDFAVGILFVTNIFTIMRKLSLKKMREAANKCGSLRDYSFVGPMLRDMHEHIKEYDDPSGFFEDLAYGGCASGMVGMFIYNSDCLKFYMRHCADLESYKEEMEEELGEPIKNRDELPHWTFLCWLCYEELARTVADTLGFEV